MSEIPEQKFMDKYTRIDEILVEMIPLLQRINAGEINVNLPEGGDMAEVVRLLAYDHEKNYKIHFFTFPNDGTRITLGAGNTELDFAAGTIKDVNGTVTKMSTSLKVLQKDSLRSIACSGDEDIVLQLDTKDKIYIRANSWFCGTYQEFTRAIITTTANTDFSLLCCTNPEAIVEMIGESTVSVGREERSQTKSVVATHFSGAIAQWGSEEENITGLTSDEITITSITAYAEQALDMRIWFFETDGFQAAAAADMDDDEFMENIHLDIPTDGMQYKNANGYYIAATEINIDYEDLDGTNELHIGLEVIGATAKLASGAGGNVWFKISYTPRL